MVSFDMEWAWGNAAGADSVCKHLSWSCAIFGHDSTGRMSLGDLVTTNATLSNVMKHL